MTVFKLIEESLGQVEKTIEAIAYKLRTRDDYDCGLINAMTENLKTKAELIKLLNTLAPDECK